MNGPRALGTTKCSSCHAEIMYVLTIDGNRMPLDTVPVADGNVWLDDDGTAHVVNRRKVNPDQGSLLDAQPPAERAWYSSHFRTCPNASQHRKVTR